MAKIKDLSEDTNIIGLKVKLPLNVFNTAKRGGLPTDEVYLRGPLMEDFFVSITAEDSRVYPLMLEINLWDELKEAEIIN